MPPKTKPKVGGGMGMIGAVGLSSGAMLASQLGSQAIAAGAAVGGAAVAADALKDIAKNPMALAAVAAVVGLLLLR
jgi:hypothetical protein